MDRPIKKKKWTVRRILTWGGLAALLIIAVYNLAFVKHLSTLAVSLDRLTLSRVEDDLHLDFILANGR